MTGNSLTSWPQLWWDPQIKLFIVDFKMDSRIPQCSDLGPKAAKRHSLALLLVMVTTMQSELQLLPFTSLYFPLGCLLSSLFSSSSPTQLPPVPFTTSSPLGSLAPSSSPGPSWAQQLLRAASCSSSRPTELFPSAMTWSPDSTTAQLEPAAVTRSLPANSTIWGTLLSCGFPGKGATSFLCPPSFIRHCRGQYCSTLELQCSSA